MYFTIQEDPLVSSIVNLMLLSKALMCFMKVPTSCVLTTTLKFTGNPHTYTNIYSLTLTTHWTNENPTPPGQRERRKNTNKKRKHSKPVASQIHKKIHNRHQQHCHSLLECLKSSDGSSTNTASLHILNPAALKKLVHPKDKTPRH